MNKPVKEGGFGMLDVKVLDDSLKLRALGRLLETKHPFLRKIRERLNLSDFFYPSLSLQIDQVSVKGIKLLRDIRQKLWLDRNNDGNRYYVEKMKEIKLSNVLNRQGKHSLAYFYLMTGNKKLIGDINEVELYTLARFIQPQSLLNSLDRTVRLMRPPPSAGDEVYLTIQLGKWLNLNTLTSKQIRGILIEKDPMTVFKCGVIMTPLESVNVFSCLNRITSTRYKTLMLRTLHGDIYTNERLFRFGLRDNPNCNSCDNVDTLEHRLTSCTGYRDLIKEVIKLTNRLTSSPPLGLDDISATLGLYLGTNEVILSIHSELLECIIYNKPRTEALAVNEARKLLTKLMNKESKSNIKNSIRDLLLE